MRKLAAFIFHPAGAVLFPLVCSFLAWWLPGYGGREKGFFEGITFEPSAWALLLVWYSTAIAAGTLSYMMGRAIGKSTPMSLLGERSVFSGRYRLFLCLVACVGVGASLFTIWRVLGAGGMLDAIRDNQANILKQALYEDYEVGVLSLRYVSILAFGVALGDFLVRRKISLLHCLAAILLFINASIASRLSLIWACAIGLGLYYHYPAEKKPLKFRLILIGVVVAFAGLTLFNFIRNAGTYERLGVDNPVAANILEIQRYLAAPFQGSLSAAQDPRSYALGIDPWTLSGIEQSLTTNSAIMAMFTQFGLVAFAVLLCICCIGGLVMGFSRERPGSIVSIAYLVMWYCFAELWRGNLFYAGITITLFTFTAGVALFGRIFAEKPTAKGRISKPALVR